MNIREAATGTDQYGLVNATTKSGLAVNFYFESLHGETEGDEWVRVYYQDAGKVLSLPSSPGRRRGKRPGYRVARLANLTLRRERVQRFRDNKRKTMVKVEVWVKPEHKQKLLDFIKELES